MAAGLSGWLAEEESVGRVESLRSWPRAHVIYRRF